MQLLALTLNYKTVPLALRERVAFPQDAAPAALAELRSAAPNVLAESALVSTCNRTELYGHASDTAAAAERVIDWLARGDSTLRAELASHARVLSQEAAARHVFRVASGLDSMVIGEPQILGQMKNAARDAHAAGTLGPLLHQLFQRAFAAAKEVRTATQIGRGAVSHGAAAVELARKMFGALGRCRVLFIGAGAMVESIAPHFAALGPAEIAIANRTQERGERLARRFGALALGLEELEASLERFDIVVSCTGSMQPLVTWPMVERRQASRADKPLLLVDLGVPRDIESGVAALPGVSLHTIDDLAERLQSGAAVRAEAAVHADALIDCHVARFSQWMALRPCAPLLRRLNEQVERLRAAELERARRILAQGQPAEEALRSLAAGLSNKLLHAPRTLLHGSTAPEHAQRFLDQWIGALERGARL